MYGFRVLAFIILLTVYTMPSASFVVPAHNLARRSIWRCNSIFKSSFQPLTIRKRTHTTRFESADDISTSSSSSRHENVDDEGWLSDNYWIQQIHKQGEERPDYQWFQERSSLPFECTACGKCCKTKGNVYMSPEEHEAAAALLEISKDDFIQQYASHSLVETGRNGDEHTWVRLLDRSEENDSALLSSEDDESGQSHGCIFLQEDNTCRIYEARPIQCSTYPFWPRILRSRQAWNDEVRRLDEDSSSAIGSTENLPPAWTREGGGCEGMQRIGDEYDDEEVDPIQGVPKEKVYEQAYWVEDDERRFPRSELSPENDSPGPI